MPEPIEPSPAGPSSSGSSLAESAPRQSESSGEPPRGGRGRSRRDPGGPLGALLAWIAILSVVAFLALTPVVYTFFPGLFESPAEGPAVIEHTPPSGPMRLISKYTLGASEFLQVQGAADADGPGAGAAELMKQVDGLAASSPSDQLRAAMLASALLGPKEGLERLDRLEEEVAQGPGGEPTELGPVFAESLAISRLAMEAGPDSLSAEQRASIVESDGWFGEVLLVSEAQANDPDRRAVYGNAGLVAMLLIVALIGVLGICVVGLGLFITAIVLLVNGKITRAYTPPAPGGSVYLEMFALFLVGFIVAQFGAGLLYSLTGVDYSKGLVWLIFPVMFYPLIRGATKAEWKHAIGWHQGKGVFREIGAGLLGYIAGLPIVALGLVCAVLLSYAVGVLVEIVTDGAAPPASHPAIDQIGSGGVLGIVMLYALAAVWAPLFEETFFRGAFFHHLRGRLGVIASALLVALIFASIHPQGIGLIPGLMGLAVVFALLREWRGSIIAPVVAHSLHNATLMTVLIVALS